MRKVFVILLVIFILIPVFPQNKSYAAAHVVGANAIRAVVPLMERQGIKFATEKAKERARKKWVADLQREYELQSIPGKGKMSAKEFREQLNQTPVPLEGKPGWGKITLDTVGALTGFTFGYEIGTAIRDAYTTSTEEAYWEHFDSIPEDKKLYSLAGFSFETKPSDREGLSEVWYTHDAGGCCGLTEINTWALTGYSDPMFNFDGQIFFSDLNMQHGTLYADVNVYRFRGTNYQSYPHKAWSVDRFGIELHNYDAEGGSVGYVPQQEEVPDINMPEVFQPLQDGEALQETALPETVEIPVPLDDSVPIGDGDIFPINPERPYLTPDGSPTSNPDGSPDGGVVPGSEPGSEPGSDGSPDLSIPSTPAGLDVTPLKTTGENFTTKFPFSIPWDVKRQFSIFNVEPEAPVWKVDRVLFSMSGKDIRIKFDLDLSQFDMIAKISRWGVLIAFNIGLILSARRFLFA